ncbi:hypothetical protein [Anabaenopsis elenkinii]|nr:hypothetical protein [Anabaenopsis elenkinii]
MAITFNSSASRSHPVKTIQYMIFQSDLSDFSFQTGVSNPRLPV